MSARLRLAPNLLLPRADIATQTYGAVGRKRSGKTYAAGKLVELVYSAGAPVVILDPVGNWYGLRLAADGKSPGLPIPVFGGLHADVPLEPDAGATIGRLVVERQLSAVLDVSQLRKNKQKHFARCFAEELFHRAQKAQRPMLVVFEEAHRWAPEAGGTGDKPLLGAVEDIVRLGGNCGLGCVMITQRPQSINKEVFNQVELLLVGQLPGPHERNAIKRWIVAKDSAHADYVDQLPSLKAGNMFAWSPSWLNIFQRVRIAKKSTFDSTATPKLGRRTKPRKLAPVDIEALGAEVQAAVERQKAEDPRHLQKRIKELELALKKAEGKTKVERVEVPVVDDRPLKELYENAQKGFDDVSKAAAGSQAKLQRTMEGLQRTLASLGGSPRQPPAPRPRAAPPRTPTQPPSGTFGRGELKVMVAVAQHSDGVTREQVTVLTGYKRSTRDAYIQRLRAAGHCEQSGDRIVATESGLAALPPDFEPLPTGDALREYWLERLPVGEREVLRVAVAAYPDDVARDAISEATGYKRSTRDAYIQRLTTRRLLSIAPGRSAVLASETLFS